MGLWDLLTSGKKTAEIEMAYVGKYVFGKKLSPLQQEKVHNLATERANLYFNPDRVNEINLLSESERVRFIFYALVMAELGIDHSLPGYTWFYVKNPFLTSFVDDRLWETTKSIVTKRYGIDESISKGRADDVFQKTI